MIAAVKMPVKLTDSEKNLFRWFVDSCRKPAIRTMRKFAEQEVIIPEGRYSGRRFRASRQPFAGQLLDEYDSGKWRRHAITGCVQSGKTFTALVIPLLYHLFEVKEDVIVGVPQMELAEDKWKKEFLPAINRVPKFRALLPSRGKGSKGGKFESLQFKHGPSIKFMSGRGGDEKRSAYTARVVLATEVDKYDTAAESSREADPITQMEARTASYDEDARIYLECTVSIPRGRIWQEYKQGSESKIVGQCPECSEWVTPEKEHFKGFQNAKTEKQAGNESIFICPECKADITNGRRAMNENAKVIHGDQMINASGVITGNLPETDTLGFRWNAFNNMFWSATFLGKQEWQALKTADEDSGSKVSCQFRWAVPWEGHEECIELTVEDIQRRQVSSGRGQVPENTLFVTVCVDVNKPILHWTAVAWLNDGTALIIDYGKKATEADKYGVDVGIARALKWLHRHIGDGWTNGGVYKAVAVDMRWKSKDIAKAILALKDKRWFGFFGMGSGHMVKTKYRQPKDLSKAVIWVGRNCYVQIAPKLYRSLRCIHADANEWKTELHERFTRDFVDGKSTEGGFSIFSSMDEDEHHRFGRHLTAEKEVVEFIPGEGHKKIWKAERSSNHWLDSTYMNLPLALRLGFNFERQELKRAMAVQEPVEVMTTSGGFQNTYGQPYMVTERD